VRQHVDESWRHDEPLRIDDCGRSRATQTSDSDNSIAFDPYIRFNAAVSGAVVNRAAFDNDVERLNARS
jgi:hypothetical protein